MSRWKPLERPAKPTRSCHRRGPPARSATNGPASSRRPFSLRSPIPLRWPGSELAALYHERWEIELGFDEIKTEILEREESLRSKSPDGVGQELWGMALLYNLVRLEMERIAALAKVPPNRISFVTALRSIKDCWFWASLSSPGTIPKRLRRMREDILRFVLPPRRSHRLFRREVKIKMSNFPRKRTAATHPGVALN